MTKPLKAQLEEANQEIGALGARISTLRRERDLQPKEAQFIGRVLNDVEELLTVPGQFSNSDPVVQKTTLRRALRYIAEHHGVELGTPAPEPTMTETGRYHSTVGQLESVFEPTYEPTNVIEKQVVINLGDGSGDAAV